MIKGSRALATSLTTSKQLSPLTSALRGQPHPPPPLSSPSLLLSRQCSHALKRGQRMFTTQVKPKHILEDYQVFVFSKLNCLIYWIYLYILIYLIYIYWQIINIYISMVEFSVYINNYCLIYEYDYIYVSLVFMLWLYNDYYYIVCWSANK